MGEPAVSGKFVYKVTVNSHSPAEKKCEWQIRTGIRANLYAGENVKAAVYTNHFSADKGRRITEQPYQCAN